MHARTLSAVMLLSLLSACSPEEPVEQQEKTFGGRLGDSYKGMLEDTKHSADFANEQMQRTEKDVRER